MGRHIFKIICSATGDNNLNHYPKIEKDSMAGEIRVSAPGNVFFFGEHSVVYERPAIVAAIDMRTSSIIRGRDDNRIVVRSEGYGSFDDSIDNLLKMKFADHNDYKDVMDPLKDLIIFFRDQTGKLRGFELDVKSDISKDSGGMSSSTAVLCSVLSALNSLHGQDIRKEAFFDWLYPFQVKIHGGAASGSEIMSSSMGGYNMVRIDKSGEKPRMEKKNLGKREYYIVIGNTGIEAKTTDTVPYVRRGWDADKDSYENVFRKIGEIVKGGEKALVEGDVKRVGELMNENHEILSRELGVSHPKLNLLIDAARKAGAYGAKMSGGGKGGIMIALTDKENQAKIADAIKSAGGVPYITSVGVEGIRIEE
jgi:mevalonate kinase